MLEELLTDFKNTLDENISKAIEENGKELRKVYLNIEVVEEIVSHIDSAPQIILKEVIHDLVSGLYSGLQALYRNAYISLRSGIELSLAYVYFLDHNYDYLFWKQDKYDVKWSVLENEETGVLSEKYLLLFSEDKFDTLFDLCKMVYRECSQFVHGKYQYMYTVRHQRVEYDKETLTGFLSMLYNLTNILIALLLIRHSNTCLDIDESYKNIIEKSLKKLSLINTLEKVKENWR